MSPELDVFEEHRPKLLGLAYRMLGEMARAEDVVQDAWIRWQRRAVEVDDPKSYLLTTVTHLCLDDLRSARARREESRSDRLPEPVDLDESGIGRAEIMDQISMAFLVVLQRLTPAERAVLLLHDVFDMGHDDIARLLGKTASACRQLLSRARQHVGAEGRQIPSSDEDHRRLLMAFVGAISRGEHERLYEMLADDAVLISDAGPGSRGKFGRIRNVGRPVVGREKIAALVRALASQDVPRGTIRERVLNGQPAAVVFRDGLPAAAFLVDVRDGRIQRIFMRFGSDRLRHIGSSN